MSSLFKSIPVSRKSSAGDGKPADIPSFTKGSSKEVSIETGMISILFFLINLDLDLLPSKLLLISKGYASLFVFIFSQIGAN